MRYHVERIMRPDQCKPHRRRPRGCIGFSTLRCSIPPSAKPTIPQRAGVLNNWTSANCRQANLTNANLSNSHLAGANFANAVVRGQSSLIRNHAGPALLDGQLPGTRFDRNRLWAVNDLTGWNLSRPEPHECRPSRIATLTNANLSGADARGANFQLATLTGANTSNLIQSNGHIAGLDLTAGKSLIVRDYDGNPTASPPTGPLPIVVDQHLAMRALASCSSSSTPTPGTRRSPFAPAFPSARGGTLELTFAPDVNLASQIGRTIDLFDWTGVTPTGTFTVSSPYTWNLSNLYTTGEVTLAAVPAFPATSTTTTSVNAADYVVWRKNGTAHPSRYDAWRAHFGTIASRRWRIDHNRRSRASASFTLALAAIASLTTARAAQQTLNGRFREAAFTAWACTSTTR